MIQFNSVAIIGVGLIGGSLGLAIRKRSPITEVIGVGRRPESLALAEKMGAIHRGTTDLALGVQGANLIIVATPVDQIVAHVRSAIEVCRAGALVTDAGSVKAEIVRPLQGPLPRGTRFLGGHPLAGREKSGPGEASADLFLNRAVVLTPTEETLDQDFDRLFDFWATLGAKVYEMSPEAHDRAVATTSHVPHAVATALAAALPREYFPLAATGFQDTTRIAAGDPELWRQIFLSNQRHMLLALEPFEQALAALRQAIAAGDRETLLQLLTLGKVNRDALGS